MATSYPGAIDSLPNPTSATLENAAGFEHDIGHSNLGDAIEAIETELGTAPKGAYASVKARLDANPPVTVATTAPGSPVVGQEWCDTTTAPAILKVWSGSAWLDATGPAGAGGGGKILQVVTVTLTASANTAGTTWVTTGLTRSITPATTASKILVTVTNQIGVTGSGAQGFITVFRGTVAGMNLGDASKGFAGVYSQGGTQITVPASISVLDSPATAAAVTYTVGIRAAAGTMYGQDGGSTAVLTLMEVGP